MSSGKSVKEQTWVAQFAIFGFSLGMNAIDCEIDVFIGLDWIGRFLDAMESFFIRYLCWGNHALFVVLCVLV